MANQDGKSDVARTPRLPRPTKICARRFGMNLREARLRLAWSQQELAARARVHRTHVSLIESGRRMARLDTICALAGALGVAPGALMPEGAGMARVE